MQKRKAETEVDAMASETSMDTAACLDAAVPAAEMNGAINGHEPAVVEEGEVTIGAGGAIVMQSDAQDEYEEMRLKARALMKAVEKCAKG